MNRIALLTLLFAASTADARKKRGSDVVVAKVPSIEEVVREEGFEPTLSQSDIYRPGSVLVPNSRGGHDKVVADCVGVTPEVSVMSQSSIATSLSAGVSARLSAVRGQVAAGVEKRLSFVDPEQRTIPLAELRASESCAEGLENAARFTDLSQAILVYDVLVAQIQNTVCTKADASGSVMMLGEAEAAAYLECVQESDAQVPLGFKSVPLTQVLTVAAATSPVLPPVVPGQPAAATASVDFGSSGGLGIDAQLAEQACRQDARAKGASARASRLSAAERDARSKASAAWRSLAGDLEKCTKLKQAQREQCITAAEQWLTQARAMPVSIPAGVEPIETACGLKQPAFAADARTVMADEVSLAEAMLVRLESSDSALAGKEEFNEENLRTAALNYHNEAKKLGPGAQAREIYELAEEAYSGYLQHFPEGKQAYEVRYGYGEVLYKLKKFDQAYEQYMTVVALDANGPRSKVSAETAIFAAEMMTETERREGKGANTKGAKKTEQVPLTNWEKKLIAACDQFAKLYREDKKTRGIIYRSAYILYNHNMFKDASDRFRVVIDMNPKSKEAEQAAFLILDSFALVEDWTNLKDVSEAFYDQEGLGSTKFKKEVYNIYERASFKCIETAFEKDKDEVKAAGSFMAFYAEFPKSEVADLALNNAAVYYYKQSQVKNAMDARIALIENFPKSKYYNSQVVALAFDYETIGDLASAADWYEKSFALDKEGATAREALFSAAIFRSELGQNDVAINNWRTFLAEYKDDPRVPNVMISIAQIFDAEEKWNEASIEYYLFFSKPPEGATLDQVFFARLQFGLALEEMGDKHAVDKHWEETLAEYDAAAAKGGDMTLAADFIDQIMAKLAEPEISGK